MWFCSGPYFLAKLVLYPKHRRSRIFQEPLYVVILLQAASPVLLSRREFPLDGLSTRDFDLSLTVHPSLSQTRTFSRIPLQQLYEPSHRQLVTLCPVWEIWRSSVWARWCCARARVARTRLTRMKIVGPNPLKLLYVRLHMKGQQSGILSQVYADYI